MGFAHAGRADEDEVDGFSKPVGVEELEDFIFRYFGIEGPVEGGQELHPFDAGHAKKMFDPFQFPFFLFFPEEAKEKGLVGRREVLHGGKETEQFPEISQRSHSLLNPFPRSRFRGAWGSGDTRADPDNRKA